MKPAEKDLFRYPQPSVVTALHYRGSFEMKPAEKDLRSINAAHNLDGKGTVRSLDIIGRIWARDQSLARNGHGKSDCEWLATRSTVAVEVPATARMLVPNNSDGNRNHTCTSDGKRYR